MSDTDDAVLAWHFTGDKLRDGRPLLADRETLYHDGPLVMCRSGFHASERLIDALHYAPGSIVWRVRCAVDIHRDTDKLLCRERTGLWHYDASEVLRSFARKCALDVAHLWGMPPIVRQYLETGDETIMAGASRAAWDARNAAWGAMSVAAVVWGMVSAAWGGASVAVAAWTAADSAVTAAAWDVMFAGDAAANARDAAWVAKGDTRDAAGDAAIATQNIRLTAMIEEGRPDV